MGKEITKETCQENQSPANSGGETIIGSAKRWEEQHVNMETTAR